MSIDGWRRIVGSEFVGSQQPAIALSPFRNGMNHTVSNLRKALDERFIRLGIDYKGLVAHFVSEMR